ncbi:MAG: Eco57I restriction-modification methylase domain-containing protein, partial [Thermodesulfobacteriota bacterium]
MWQPIWAANCAVAEAYGLTPDDFAYILTTFPLFARKRPEFYAYLQGRVQEWKEERGERREVKGERENPRAFGLPPLAFQQAAVLAWVVHKLYSPGHAVSRFRVQKMLYLIEAATETGLFTEFRKHAAGPYDPDLRYGGPEDIAVGQRRWLVMPDDTHFAPGSNIEEALHDAPQYIDVELAELALEEFRTFKDETLERWTT